MGDLRELGSGEVKAPNQLLLKINNFHIFEIINQ